MRIHSKLKSYLQRLPFCRLSLYQSQSKRDLVKKVLQIRSKLHKTTLNLRTVKKNPIKIDYEKLVEVTIKHSQITRIAFAAFEEMWKVEISLCFFKDGTKNANGNNSQAQKTKEKVH